MPRPSRPAVVVPVLAAAGIVASLVQTLVMPLISELPTILDTNAANASWVLTATLLVGGVSTPVIGKLGDMYGKRTLLLVTAVPLTLGSVVCALSDSLWPMLIGRGLQGLGVGMVPLGISAMRDILPQEKLGSAIALMSSSLGIGGALGMPLAALIADYSDWHALFWVTAVLSVSVAVLIYLFIPATAAPARGRIDVLGILGLGTALVCLLLGISKGGEWGWTSMVTLGMLGAAVVILPIWGWWELRCEEPLVDLRVTARPQVLLTNAASILTGFGMYALPVIVMQILMLPAATGYTFGLTMLEAGLAMAPGGLMMVLMSRPGARLSATRGPKTTLVTGCLVIAAGYGLVLLSGPLWAVIAATTVSTVGVALAYGAMPALIMNAVPRSRTAAANSFNTLMRAIGTSTAAAVVGAVTAQLTMDLGGNALPSLTGFRVALLIGSAVAVGAAVIALALPRHSQNDYTRDFPARDWRRRRSVRLSR